MATYAALVSLMQVIRDVQHHPSPPVSLDKQLVDSITQHITFFHEFLQASYNPLLDLDEEVADPLEMRIASAAYAAEDAIESHILDIFHKNAAYINPPLDQDKEATDPLEMCIASAAEDAIESHIDGSFLAPLTNLLKAPKTQKNADDEMIRSVNLWHDRLHSAIEEMDSIKKVVVGTLDTQDIKKKMLVVHDHQVPMKNAASHKETMVGLDAALLQILEKLTGGQLDRQVIPIAGMGGIGKTFLAKTIYATPLIKEYFFICTWATISLQYNTREMLCEILSQATKKEKEQLSKKSEDELGSELHKYLFGRRFLIVLDDMWSIDAWDKIQRFFPNNQNGSRILVTTRLSLLSSQLNNNYSLHMSFLDEASSWDLFSKTVFGDKSPCPHELKEIGEKIVERCRGLPLSIVVVGGLLKNMDADQVSWESIQDNLSSEVNMDNEKHCLKLLKMSYNHLPEYLKPCFLYMGVFEEDREIRVGSLIKLWVSEGFLKPTNGEALETTARGLIHDLIDRNLILAHKLGSTGSIKYCKIHDSLRDMCLKEGQKEGFYHVIGQCNPPPQGTNTRRRIVIPNNTSMEKVWDELASMSHARSIIGEFGTNVNTRLLRTLHLSGYERDMQSLPYGRGNLRYLTINAGRIPSSLLPSLASNTWNLQTLIVNCIASSHSSLLFDFWKMPQLRHIVFDRHIVYDRGCFHTPAPPSDGDDVVIMENLITLKGVRNFKYCKGVVKRIPNIKKLRLLYSNEDNEYFVENIQYMCRLESLSIISVSGYVPNKLTFPHSLKKFHLYVKYSFEWEAMLEKVGSLPLLEKLQVNGGKLRKEEWKIVEGQFPSLKHMKLSKCSGLKTWTAAEEGSNILPRLEHLHIQSMDELEKIPLELGNIDTLKSIKLVFCGEGAVKCAKEMVDEQVESQGEEQLSFHVEVHVLEREKHLLSLAGPNIVVDVSSY